MIIFLYGPDSFRIRQEVNSVKDKYKKKYPNGIDFYNFDLAAAGTDTLDDAIKTASFFREVKLIALKNSFEKDNPGRIMKLIKDYGLKDDKLTVLLFGEPSAEKDLKAKDGKLFSVLTDKQNLVRNFEKLDGSKLEAWVKKEFSLRNCLISSVLARKLIQLAGSDTDRLIAEINKLSNYRLKGEIAGIDIDKLVSKKAELSIFDLIDAIAAKNKARALELLYQELQTGRDPYYILTMITYQLRNALVVKDLSQRGLSGQEIAKKAKLHPFVVRKMVGSNKYAQDEIRRYFNSLAQADISIKQGKTDIEDCLYGLILS